MTTYLKKPYYEIKPCNICDKYCDDNVLIKRNQYCRKCLDTTWVLLGVHLDPKLKDNIIDDLITNHKEILKIINMLQLH